MDSVVINNLLSYLSYHIFISNYGSKNYYYKSHSIICLLVDILVGLRF